jgi:hypothetical protein
MHKGYNIWLSWTFAVSVHGGVAIVVPESPHLFASVDPIILALTAVAFSSRCPQ